ncbi:MAG: YceI family protein [Sphingobacteriia bacterium]|nr:YceI family protein [Sphingobacteriia bacterium]
MQKPLFLLILLFVLSGFTPPDNGRATWVVMQGSSLTVNGSTNINTFQCVIPNYSMPDTISLVRGGQKGVTLPMNGKLNLSVEAFDCHNKMMTSDLRKTLKAKTYPVLTVRFVSVNGFPDLKNPVKITGIVDIGLAGVTKRFEINYLFTSEERQQIQLKGDQLIHFSDFNLTPPSKLGGVIKAKDELKVEFILHLKPLN